MKLINIISSILRRYSKNSIHFKCFFIIVFLAFGISENLYSQGQLITICGTTSISGTTVGRANNCGGQPAGDAQYYFVAPLTGSYTFSTCGGATWDTYIYLGTAACGTNMGVSDDACSTQSSFTASLTAGTTYYFTMDGWSTNTGIYTFTITPPSGCSGTCVTSLSTTTTSSCAVPSNGSVTLSYSNGLTAVKRIRITTIKSDWFNVADLKAFHLFTGVNLATVAQSATTNQSSCYTGNAAYCATSLIDNNATTIYHSNSASGNEWAEVTLATASPLDRIEIVNRGDCCHDRENTIVLDLFDASGALISSRRIDAHQGQNYAYTSTWDVSGFTWSNGATTQNLSNVAPGNYTFTYSDIRCGSVNTVATVGTTAAPTAVTVSTAGSYCINTTLTAANGGSGTIYYQGTTSNGLSIATPSTSQVISTSGTYYFRAQSSGGCWGTQGSAAVTISPTSVGGSVTGGSTPICQGAATGTMTLGGHTGTITRWERQLNSGGWVNIGNAGSTTYSETPSSDGTWEYRAVVTSGACTSANSAIRTIVVRPQPQGSFTGNTICGDGSGTGQLTWTASAGTGPYSVNWGTAAAQYYNYVTSTAYSTTNGSVVSGTPFTIVASPVSTTTYTATSVSDANGCSRSSGFTASNAVITVTDPFPSPALTNITAGSIPGYSPPGAVGATWGNNGATGATIGYNATTWPSCTSYGFTLPSINAAANTYVPLQLDVTDATNTNLATGKACFEGTSTFYYTTTGGAATNSVWPVRCRIIMGGSKPLQYIPSLNSLMTKADANFSVQVVMECYPPSGVMGVTGGSWQAVISVFDAMHAPPSGTGSTIYTNLYPALTTVGGAVSGTNTSFFNFNGPVITATANTPCIAYASGGVPTGGPLNLTGGIGTLNASPCSLTHLWTSSEPALTNTGSQNPTPGVANATSTSLTTYTYTVSSGSNRVCYGRGTSATVTANTTSPTTWNAAPTNGVTATNTAGADNWYTHSNWSNCVPCNNTSPACAKQAVINTATNYPNINTGTAKATTVLHNATPGKITIAAPTATLKLINP